MRPRKSKTIKNIKGLGLNNLNTANLEGNRVRATTPYIPFEKKDIEQPAAARFEAMVEKYGAHTAVIAEDESATYELLNRRANRVAHHILEVYDDSRRLSEAEKTRYSRQMRLQGWGIKAQETLKGTTVFAAGAGGSASPLVMQLALAGVGTIVICDYDEVELSNLNRQVLHDDSRIGMNKALSAQKTVEKINPHVTVITYTEKISAENIHEMVGEAAIIFDNVDDIEAKFALSQCAADKNIPHIISSMMDMDAYVAVFKPPQGPCYHCLYDHNILREISEIKKYRENQKQSYDKFTNPVSSSALFLATGFAVNEAIKIILDLGKPSYNKYFFFDQRGVKNINDSMGYRQIIYPFSNHFKETCKQQGFDWNEGSDRFIEELTVTPDPKCPLCAKRKTAPGKKITNREKETPSPLNKSFAELSRKRPHGGSVPPRVAGPPEGPSEAKMHSVALLFQHGGDMITGLLGVLKSGMLYVPLDASYPVERLGYILEDSEARVLVTNRENQEMARQLVGMVNNNIAVVDIDGLPAGLSEENPNLNIQPTDPAYILYTSGSTGKPKGVIQNQRNLLHHARVYTNALHLTKDDRLTLFSSYGFDAAKMDIYGALFNGAVLYPYDIKKQDNLQRLADWLVTEQITIYHSIPTVYRYFTDLLRQEAKERLAAIRFIVLGGEAVFKKDIDNYKNYFSRDCLFINGLGPTESTVTVQYFLDHETEVGREAVPVGYAVDETEVYLLSEDDKEVGVFGVGEIVFKSDHLAVGYWKNPQQTQKVFVTDPVTGKGRVYRTGDLGRRLPDGTIEYVGRNDFQVKISGYRVELGEIESRLDRCTGIRKSVVVCRQDDNGENFTAAYYTSYESASIDESELISELKAALPPYMIPALFIEVDEFPLTATGKVDRKKLSLQDVKHMLPQGETQAPQNDTEQRLLELWQEVLKQEEFGVTDNFFLLGGNSIKAILLGSKIEKEMQVSTSIAEIFNRPTIRELAAHMSSAAAADFSVIPIADKREYYPLTSAQQRLFFLSQFENVGTRFNIFMALQIKGNLEKERYQTIMENIMRRHEALRTYFHLVDNKPVQKIHSFEELTFTPEHYRSTTYDESVESSANKAEIHFDPDAHRDVLDLFIRPFNLSTAPLFRVGIYSLSREEHYFLFDIHHTVFDGTSSDILIRDFQRLYQGEELEAPRLHYKDFALWQSRRFESDGIAGEEKYWLELYNDLKENEVPRIDLPTAYPRPEYMSYEGTNYRFLLDKGETDQLNKLAQTQNASLFMVLLAIYNVFLARISHRDDIIVGTVTAGRNHADIENLLGVFINLLPLRNLVSREKQFADFLEEVTGTTVASFENQDYPFEYLVEKIPGSRDVSRHPLLDVGFTLQNISTPETNTKGENKEDLALKLVSLKPLRDTARNDLNLEGFEIDGRLELEFQYRTGLFKEETVITFSNYLKRLITEVLQAPDRRIKDIRLLSEAQREQLLVAFNDTARERPAAKTVVTLFEEQVERTPDNLAVISAMEMQNIYDQLKSEDIEIEMTYEELNERANQLAHRLKARGIGPGNIVGLMLGHPLEKFVGIWGILKSGGAYLPMDPTYPPDMIRGIFLDSDVPLVVSETLLEETIEALNISSPIVWIDEPGEEEEEELENPQPVNSLEDLAYIIYTSGTTGKPKGTALQHRGIVNYAAWRIAYFEFSDEDVTLQPLSYNFDSFCANFYATHLSGGQLVVVPDNRRIDYPYIADLVESSGVTNVCFAPGIYRVLLDAAEAAGNKLESMRLAVLAGEACTPALVEKSRECFPHIRLANEYGPTEGTVAATALPQIEAETVTVIGTPLENVRIYILDHSLNLALPGTPGEICIGGAGVASGYLNNPELTAEKFIANPFASTNEPAEEKNSTPFDTPMLYRSGDMGRWITQSGSPNHGKIEFLGRIDQQVKIRGFRIELEHIEACLAPHP
ncbi:MAG: amino acid adenylation domain-containing protein, partial [bacterium]|nr:amino acid adenylation domain-containing protein [bacterium]